MWFQLKVIVGQGLYMGTDVMVTLSLYCWTGTPCNVLGQLLRETQTFEAD